MGGGSQNSETRILPFQLIYIVEKDGIVPNPHHGHIEEGAHGRYHHIRIV